MVQALIRINGVAGSNTDMPIDTALTFSNLGTGGEITYLWELLEQPDGTADTLGTPTNSTSALTPKKEGTYLVQLTVNKDLTTQKIDTVVVGIRAIKSNLRFPAPSEGSEAGADGWGPEINAAVRDIDDGKKQIRVVGYTAGDGTFAYGEAVRFSGATSVKTGLPGAEYVPNIIRCDVSTSNLADDPFVGVVLNSTRNTTPGATNTMVYVATAGYVSGVTVTGTPAAGDYAYLGNTAGQMSKTPGAIERAVGKVVRVVSGNVVDIVMGTAPPIPPTPGSWVDLVNRQFTGTPATAQGDFTYGIKFRPIRSGLTCKGIRFYWGSGPPITVKCRLWKNGVSQADVNVAVTGAGFYTGTFGSPVSLTDAVSFFATIWETGAAEYMPARAVTAILGTGIWAMRNYFIIDKSTSVAGDNEPTTPVAGDASEVEPVI